MSQPESGEQDQPRPELGLKPMSINTVKADDPRLLAIFDDYLAKIQEMSTEYDKIVDEFSQHSHIDFVEDEMPPKSNQYKYIYNRTPEYMHALKKYKEFNVWPLHNAVYYMAIKLLLSYNEQIISKEKTIYYRKKLLEALPKQRNTMFMHIGSEELPTLISKWNSGKEMNKVVSEQLENDYNERISARMSNLTRGGRKIKTNARKSLKSATTKSKTRKSIAAAIKDIPLSKARADFAALKAVPCADINQAAKVGNAVMDHYFFRHRLAAKTKRAISYYDWIRTDWMRNESEHSFYKFNLGQGKTPEKARYAVFRLYYGAIHGFKPLIAKWMYCTYEPRIAVLDFSAGWGGRCLGAMSLGIPYIGIDTNKDLRPVYERMVKELDSEPNSKSNPKVTMRFQDAAATDFSRFKYDMVFTSPPYFKTVKPIEGYAHMPHYNDRADFNARFLFPVVRNTYANLARGGTYALNIPDDMYDEIKAAGILPARLLAKHRLFLQPRFAKGNPNHPDVQYKEHIYVWKKP